MPDQETATVAPDLSTEIGASLASVWARYVGARPASAEVHLDGSSVRWTIADGTRAFEEGMSAEPGEEASGQRAERTLSGYRRETSAAVAKATHRHVSAHISKQDKKTGTATETFILEPMRIRH